MKNYLLPVTTIALLLGFILSSAASETITIDFEGLGNQRLTDQIPGLLFEYVDVMTPAIVNSSTGPNLSAATSGQAAASTFGAKIRFSKPVIQVAMKISPSFVTVPLDKSSAYVDAYLIAYDQQDRPIARAVAPVIAAVSQPEYVLNFTPTMIGVSASIPIAYVTVDIGDPWRSDGSRFLFDDLTLTIAGDQTLVKPTLRIERVQNRKFTIAWDFSTADLQQAVDLRGPWENVALPFHGYYEVDTTKGPLMFFRVRR